MLLLIVRKIPETRKEEEGLPVLQHRYAKLIMRQKPRKLLINGTIIGLSTVSSLLCAMQITSVFTMMLCVQTWLLGDRLHCASTNVSTFATDCVKIDLLMIILILLCLFRYGWTNNMSVVILRLSHHENCAKNMTGFIINSRVDATENFDALCYDKKGDYIHKNLSLTLYQGSPKLILQLLKCYVNLQTALSRLCCLLLFAFPF